MKDFKYIRNHCEKGNKVSAIVIDEFLLYYAADRDKLAAEFEQKVSRFKPIYKKMPQSWYGLVKAQYICHRIFKQNGLIHQYLNHSVLKNLLRNN
jgi:hypothetical protein